MKSILLTCPPMLGMLDEFRPLLESRGLCVEAADVVQTLSEVELIERVPHHDGWIIGDDPATRRVFESGSAGKLKAAVKWGVGVDNVDFAAARDCGIAITHTPNMFGREVADVAMGYVVGLARGLFLIDREVRAGGWPKPRGMSLYGKTVGLVGYGDIGTQTARRLTAAGMQVVVFDPAIEALNESDAVRLSRWPEEIETCDILVFTCSLTPQNRHMLNDEILARCKTGIHIVNVSRGPLIDEQALVEHLRSGHVGGAALDVMETEPLPEDAALRGFPQCVFGSHNASNTHEAVHATSLRAIDKLCEFLA